jgi:hypothetical protein
MVVFELSPEDVLTFDVEDISDTMQSSIALSCSDITDNSLVLFAVSSNPPFRYSITPDTGFLLMSEPCVMSVTLSNSELGLVRFLSTVPGDYFLSDHIAVVADILTSSDASDFANLPATEQPDAIRQYFLTHSGTFGRELSVEYHFSSDFMQMLTIFCSPEPASVTLAVSPFENITGFKLPVDQEVECEEFEALAIDDTVINDNQSGLGVAPMQDTMSCVDNEPLELSTTVVPPKTMTKKRQQLNNSSSLKKRPKTKNNSKAFTVAGVDTTAGTENVSCTIPRLPATLMAHAGWKIIGTASLDESIFTSKSALLDNFLTTRINDYIIDIREQLCSKLENVGFEVNDLNLFTFLLSSGLEYIIEYLNESLTRMGLNKTSMHEFRWFIGTLLLLSSFNLSTEQSWDLMEKITNNKVIINERFNEIIKNLCGFEVSMRHGGG